MPVYLDYAATAPVRPAIRQAVCEALGESLGNPSSLHGYGRRARMMLESARERCAAALGVRVEEIVFTSGATEANNLALAGVMRLARRGARLLWSAVEHPSVGQFAAALGGDELPVDRDGTVVVEAAAERITPEVALVSVMAANNEVGSVQPIAALSGLCRERGVLLHVDAVQGLPPPGTADLLSISGHKLGGLPGGLLMVRKGLRLAPMLMGGSQEDSRRAGTPNLAGALALGMALEARDEVESRRIRALRERFEAKVAAAVPGGHLLGKGAQRVAHISSWLFDSPAETLLARLDMEGVAASSGSACSSHSLEPSRVLLAMGYAEERASRLVRFSLGWATTAAEVERAAEVLVSLLGVPA